MENTLFAFGDKPWEQEMKKDMDNHIDSVKYECAETQEKYEKKAAEEKRKKEEAKKKAEEEKRKAEEALQLASAGQQNSSTVAVASKAAPIVIDEDSNEWKSIGSKRITHYCPVCNKPKNSYASSSGKRLAEGAVACSWLPLGTVIKINGKKYKVLDRCGTNAIDIFRDTPGKCSCNKAGSYYAKVYILKKKGKPMITKVEIEVNEMKEEKTTEKSTAESEE